MLLLTNAEIFTFDTQNPKASALLIDRGRILALGGTKALRRDVGVQYTEMDMHGQVIIPGLTDSHIHLDFYAFGLQNVDCETPTLQECLRRVGERAASLPPGAWILGHGWNQNAWEQGFGSAADLDGAAQGHPVYLTAKSYHAAWVNSLALRLAGITAAAPDPSGGRLGRDASGAPDGILFESAMDLVSAVIPQPDENAAAQALRKAQPVLWSMGLTGAHDMDRRRCFRALQTLHAAGELKLRVLKSIPLENLTQAAEIGLQSGFGDDFLRIGPVKAFMDGALGPQTAAMLQPYENNPQERGMLMMDAEELFEHGRQAADAGLAMAVHAIGDRANHEVLDAFAQLRAYEKQKFPARPGLPHRIEHVQLLHPQDVERLAQLGVTASMQPIHATSDMLIADRHWGERAAWSYAWRSQLQSGAALIFGSDAPVETPNPFHGVHAAVTRRRQDGSPDEPGWYPEQRLTVSEALFAYSRAPAQAAGWGDRLGKLAPGYYADLLALDENPFTCDPQRLWQISPTGTMVNGEWVWQA